MLNKIFYSFNFKMVIKFKTTPLVANQMFSIFDVLPKTTRTKILLRIFTNNRKLSPYSECLVESNRLVPNFNNIAQNIFDFLA